jgi:hypothetical protein
MMPFDGGFGGFNARLIFRAKAVLLAERDGI